MIRTTRNVVIFLILAAMAGGGALYFTRASTSVASTPVHEEKEGHAHGAEAPVMSDEKIAAVGIELETAGPATLRDTVALNGILQPNQEALAQITPRFPGVIRELRKRVGDKVTSGEVLAKIESNQSLTTYELRAPMAGTIVDRQAALGEFASEQKALFTIADLTTVWVDFSVYRRDLSNVRVDSRVTFDPEDGGQPIEAKITYVSPLGNSDTQSALARALVPNPEGRLRPGLFVTGRLLLAEKPVPLAVKTSALQTVENKTVVFVRSGEKFEPREVELGARDRDSVEVVFGLLEGDRYAARNSFVIKAEIGKGTAAHEH